jgi:hypothetical protein
MQEKRRTRDTDKVFIDEVGMTVNTSITNYRFSYNLNSVSNAKIKKG